ncbi:MAG: PEP-utilizing enzyme [bacterium]
MNLKNLSKKNWNLEHYDGCPAFLVMTGSGFTKQLYDSNIPVYKISASYYENHQGDWLTLCSDHKKIGSAIVDIFIKNKNEIIRLHEKWLKNFELMMKNFYDWQDCDLTKLNNKQLLEWSKTVYEFYRYVSMPGFIDGYMFYADKRFDFLIKKYCEENKIKNYHKIFSILSAPIDLSFISEEDDDLRKIAVKIKKSGFKNESLKKFLSKKKDLAILIESHLIKYSWIKSSYVGYKEYGFKEMEDEIKRIFKHKQNKILEKHKRQKEKLFRKYKFTPEIKAILRLTEIFIKWQDQRKVYTLTFITLADKILKEISRRTRIDHELLRYSCSREFKDILTKRFNVSELKKRREASLFIYKNGKIMDIYTGREAKNFLNIVSRLDFEDVNEISGIAVSMGKATGKVKIIMAAKNISKIEKGDILVAPMTRPEHLVGMKKAAAIITNDGGITCHAAIIARELKIPCIIGTKIATKVLKDGDMVEVDAEKGIVKILK